MTNINAEAEITQLTALVRLRRAEAKDCRDDDDLEGAVAALADAVSALRRSPLYAEVMDTATTTPSPQARQLAAQLADCLGMRGGNLRRLDRLDQALKCFDEGRALEESTRLALDSSYNLVNAVTLPIETGSATVPAQRAALERAVQSIDRQLRGARRSDRWAWADIGQCQLLLGRSSEALHSYRRARDLGDSATLASMTAVLQRLRSVLAGSDADTAAGFEEVLRSLTD